MRERPPSIGERPPSILERGNAFPRRCGTLRESPENSGRRIPTRSRRGMNQVGAPIDPARRRGTPRARPVVDLRRRIEDPRRDRSSGRRAARPGRSGIEGVRSPMKGVRSEMKVAGLPIDRFRVPAEILGALDSNAARSGHRPVIAWRPKTPARLSLAHRPHRPHRRPARRLIHCRRPIRTHLGGSSRTAATLSWVRWRSPSDSRRPIQP